MRLISLCIAIALFAVLLAVSDAEAQTGGGCSMSCNNQLSSCQLAAGFHLDSCFGICQQLYPSHNSQWVACRANCQAYFQQEVTVCQDRWDTCMGQCPEPTDPDNCPIVIDLGHGTFDFTSPEAGVTFDINANGRPVALSWTDGNGGDGFLVLDRDQNGRIDSGFELFGVATPQPPAAERNGYAALAVYDDNADGLITNEDAVWSSLQIWVDANHNGISEAAELAGLGQYKIRGIDLRYHESRRKDRYGNELRYWSKVLRDDEPPTFAVDVFFKGLQ